MDTTKFTPRKLLVPGVILSILIVLATLPLTGVSPYTFFTMGLTIMYVILAVSWAMFSGPTGYMSLAPAAFVGIGIYVMARLRDVLPLGAIILAAVLCSFIIALLVGLVTLRLKGIYFAIFTFGFVVFLGNFIRYYEFHILGTRGRLIEPVSNETFYYIMLGIAAATLLTAYLIRRSRLGLAMQSIGGNEEAAAHMGVNTTMVKVLTFAISAVFMGAAGATLATRIIYTEPMTAFSVLYSFTPVLMAVFGGMGQIYGPVVGAIIFSYLQHYLSGRFPQYYMLSFGIILILFILYLPGGLAGLIPQLRDRLRGPISKLLKGGKAEQHANT